jgi:hypothetical protein
MAAEMPYIQWYGTDWLIVYQRAQAVPRLIGSLQYVECIPRRVCGRDFAHEGLRTRQLSGIVHQYFLLTMEFILSMSRSSSIGLIHNEPCSLRSYGRDCRHGHREQGKLWVYCTNIFRPE